MEDYVSVSAEMTLAARQNRWKNKDARYVKSLIKCSAAANDQLRAIMIIVTTMRDEEGERER